MVRQLLLYHSYYSPNGASQLCRQYTNSDLVFAEKREVLPEDVTEADLNSYIAGANTAISPFDFEIRSSLHQTTQTRIYALVNTTSDPLTQLATTYTADEIAFVKRILDAMFETYNTRREEAMVVSSMQAIQLAKPSNNNRESLNRRESEGGATQGSGQGLTMKEAEGMMGRLVEEGWLEKSRKGFYSLSARALMELRAWLVATYNDVDEDEDDAGRGRIDKVKMCFACKEIVTVVSFPTPFFPTTFLSGEWGLIVREGIGSTMSATTMPWSAT
jgi:hypothetical protein